MTDQAHAWKWIWPELDATLLVRHSVACELERHRQSWWQKECGGQLFVSTDSNAGIELVLATLPHALDRAGRTWLELNKDRCSDEIKLANQKQMRLVGYWHTHPQRIPQISSQDIVSFRRFIFINKELLPYPLAVIVGNSTSRDAVRAWSIRPDGLHLAQRHDHENS